MNNPRLINTLFLFCTCMQNTGFLKQDNISIGDPLWYDLNDLRLCNPCNYISGNFASGLCNVSSAFLIKILPENINILTTGVIFSDFVDGDGEHVEIVRNCIIKVLSQSVNIFKSLLPLSILTRGFFSRFLPTSTLVQNLFLKQQENFTSMYGSLHLPNIFLETHSDVTVSCKANFTFLYT